MFGGEESYVLGVGCFMFYGSVVCVWWGGGGGGVIYVGVGWVEVGGGGGGGGREGWGGWMEGKGGGGCKCYLGQSPTR